MDWNGDYALHGNFGNCFLLHHRRGRWMRMNEWRRGKPMTLVKQYSFRYERDERRYFTC